MKKTDQNLMFEKFRILKTIKQDTYRAVYIAEHIFLGKTIFLKTINKKYMTDPVLLDRFKREAQILAQLDHPNIIKVWDFGTYDDYFYISFEHFKSQNLREILSNNILKEEDKKRLIVQLMTGLQYAHDHQIIHRDLKPENILLNENLNLKIADFGLATIENQAGSTEDTTIVGTPAYMSPEQIQGQELTGQTDLFSMGIIIYEIYNGKNPFLGADTGTTLNNILNLDLDSLKTDTTKLPDDINIFIKKLLSRKPANRPRRIEFPGMEISVHSQDPEIQPQSASHIFRYSLILATLLIMGSLIIYLKYKANQDLNEKTNLVKQSVENIDMNNDSIATKSVTNVHKDIIPELKQTPSKLTLHRSSETVRSEEPVENPPQMNVLQSGFLMVECQPWADIYIDGVKKESTPLKNPLQIAAGVHQLKLVHPEYPQLKRKISLNPDETLNISVNLDTTIGYFTCHVHPWGDVFIDGQSIGQTPLNKYIRLESGKHTLVIKNPGFSDYSKIITISKNDTVSINISLSKRDLAKTSDSG